MKTISLVVLAVLIGALGVTNAQVPQIINYQGRVGVNGTNFDGTGQFKFALVNGTGTTAYWSNGTSVVSLPPANVAVCVSTSRSGP